MPPGRFGRQASKLWEDESDEEEEEPDSLTPRLRRSMRSDDLASLFASFVEGEVDDDDTAAAAGSDVAAAGLPCTSSSSLSSRASLSSAGAMENDPMSQPQQPQQPQQPSASLPRWLTRSRTLSAWAARVAAAGLPLGLSKEEEGQRGHGHQHPLPTAAFLIHQCNAWLRACDHNLPHLFDAADAALFLPAAVTVCPTPKAAAASPATAPASAVAGGSFREQEEKKEEGEGKGDEEPATKCPTTAITRMRCPPIPLRPLEETQAQAAATADYLRAPPAAFLAAARGYARYAMKLALQQHPYVYELMQEADAVAAASLVTWEDLRARDRYFAFDPELFSDYLEGTHVLSITDARASWLLRCLQALARCLCLAAWHDFPPSSSSSSTLVPSHLPPDIPAADWRVACALLNPSDFLPLSQWLSAHAEWFGPAMPRAFRLAREQMVAAALASGSSVSSTISGSDTKGGLFSSSSSSRLPPSLPPAWPSISGSGMGGIEKEKGEGKEVIAASAARAAVLGDAALVGRIAGYA